MSRRHRSKRKFRDLIRKIMRRKRNASDAIRDSMRDCRRLHGMGLAR